MADKVKKAHGHIIQADWNQTDPLQMDYIHNKPNIVDSAIDYVVYDRQVTNVTSTTHPTTPNMLVSIAREYLLPVEINSTAAYKDTHITFTVKSASLPSLTDNDYEFIIINSNVNSNFSAIETDPQCIAYFKGINQGGDSQWHYSDKVLMDSSAELFSVFFFDGAGMNSAQGIPNSFPEDVQDPSFLISRSITLNYSIAYYTYPDHKEPTHSTSLYSTKNIQYNYPITKINISSLNIDPSIQDLNTAKEVRWQLSFIADDNNCIDIPNIIDITTSVGIIKVPVIWQGGKKLFKIGEHYKLDFEYINKTIIIKTICLDDNNAGILLSEGTDLNTIVIPDLYRSPSGVVSNTLVNTPYTETGFRLEVFNTTSINQIIQEIKCNSASARVYRRIANFSDGTWTFQSWYQVIQSTTGKVALTSQVSGALPIANGGTASTTKLAAKNTLEIYNHNLLINSNFIVNQRGTGSATTVGTFIADRWKIWNTAGTVQWTGGPGIKLIPSSNKANYANFGIVQFIDYRLSQCLVGKTVTLSAKIKSTSAANVTMFMGFANSSNGVMTSKGTATAPAAGKIISYSKTITAADVKNGSLGCVLSFYKAVSGITVEVDYIKLEIGSTYTDFIPNSYADELFACQYYLQWYNGYSSKQLGFTASGTSYAYVDIPLTRPMLTTPTVTCIDPSTLNGLTRLVLLSNVNLNSASMYPIGEVIAYTATDTTLTLRVLTDVTLGNNMCWLTNCPPLLLEAEI